MQPPLGHGSGHILSPTPSAPCKTSYLHTSSVFSIWNLARLAWFFSIHFCSTHEVSYAL